MSDITLGVHLGNRIDVGATKQATQHLGLPWFDLEQTRSQNSLLASGANMLPGVAATMPELLAGSAWQPGSSLNTIFTEFSGVENELEIEARRLVVEGIFDDLGDDWEAKAETWAQLPLELRTALEAGGFEPPTDPSPGGIQIPGTSILKRIGNLAGANFGPGNIELGTGDNAFSRTVDQALASANPLEVPAAGVRGALRAFDWLSNTLVERPMRVAQMGQDAMGIDQMFDPGAAPWDPVEVGTGVNLPTEIGKRTLRMAAGVGTAIPLGGVKNILGTAHAVFSGRIGEYWELSEDRNATFRPSVVAEVRETYLDGDELLSLMASAYLSSGGNLTQAAAEISGAEPGTAAFEEVYLEYATLFNPPEPVEGPDGLALDHRYANVDFQAAIEKMSVNRIGIGVDFAESIGLRQGTTSAAVAGAGYEFLFLAVVDPTIVGGKVNMLRKIVASGARVGKLGTEVHRARQLARLARAVDAGVEFPAQELTTAIRAANADTLAGMRNQWLGNLLISERAQINYGRQVDAVMERIAKAADDADPYTFAQLRQDIPQVNYLTQQLAIAKSQGHLKNTDAVWDWFQSVDGHGAMVSGFIGRDPRLGQLPTYNPNAVGTQLKAAFGRTFDMTRRLPDEVADELAELSRRFREGEIEVGEFNEFRKKFDADYARAFAGIRNSILNPIVLANRLVKHVPRERFVATVSPADFRSPVVTAEANKGINEFERFLNFADFGSMPMEKATRDAYLKLFIEGNQADRMATVRLFTTELLARTGMLDSSEQAAAIIGRYGLGLDELYSTTQAGDNVLRSTATDVLNRSALWASQVADAVMIPDYKGFKEAVTKYNTMTAFVGQAHGLFDIYINKIWRRMVLLRAGFIPRAAGEEATQFVLRLGFKPYLQSKFGQRWLSGMVTDPATGRWVPQRELSPTMRHVKAVAHRARKWTRTRESDAIKYAHAAMSPAEQAQLRNLERMIQTGGRLTNAEAAFLRSQQSTAQFSSHVFPSAFQGRNLGELGAAKDQLLAPHIVAWNQQLSRTARATRHFAVKAENWAMKVSPAVFDAARTLRLPSRQGLARALFGAEFLGYGADGLPRFMRSSRRFFALSFAENATRTDLLSGAHKVSGDDLLQAAFIAHHNPRVQRAMIDATGNAYNPYMDQSGPALKDRGRFSDEYQYTEHTTMFGRTKYVPISAPGHEWSMITTADLSELDARKAIGLAMEYPAKDPAIYDSGVLDALLSYIAPRQAAELEALWGEEWHTVYLEVQRLIGDLPASGRIGMIDALMNNNPLAPLGGRFADLDQLSLPTKHLFYPNRKVFREPVLMDPSALRMTIRQRMVNYMTADEYYPLSQAMMHLSEMTGQKLAMYPPQGFERLYNLAVMGEPAEQLTTLLGDFEVLNRVQARFNQALRELGYDPTIFPVLPDLLGLDPARLDLFRATGASHLPISGAWFGDPDIPAALAEVLTSELHTVSGPGVGRLIGYVDSPTQTLEGPGVTRLATLDGSPHAHDQVFTFADEGLIGDMRLVETQNPAKMLETTDGTWLEQDAFDALAADARPELSGRKVWAAGTSRERMLNQLVEERMAEINTLYFTPRGEPHTELLSHIYGGTFDPEFHMRWVDINDLPAQAYAPIPVEANDLNWDRLIEGVFNGYFGDVVEPAMNAIIRHPAWTHNFAATLPYANELYHEMVRGGLNDWGVDWLRAWGGERFAEDFIQNLHATRQTLPDLGNIDYDEPWTAFMRLAEDPNANPLEGMLAFRVLTDPPPGAGTAAPAPAAVDTAADAASGATVTPSSGPPPPGAPDPASAVDLTPPLEYLPPPSDTRDVLGPTRADMPSLTDDISDDLGALVEDPALAPADLEAIVALTNGPVGTVEGLMTQGSGGLSEPWHAAEELYQRIDPLIDADQLASISGTSSVRLLHELEESAAWFADRYGTVGSYLEFPGGFLPSARASSRRELVNIAERTMREQIQQGRAGEELYRKAYDLWVEHSDAMFTHRMHTRLVDLDRAWTEGHISPIFAAQERRRIIEALADVNPKRPAGPVRMETLASIEAFSPVIQNQLRHARGRLTKLENRRITHTYDHLGERQGTAAQHIEWAYEDYFTSVRMSPGEREDRARGLLDAGNYTETSFRNLEPGKRDPREYAPFVSRGKKDYERHAFEKLRANAFANYVQPGPNGLRVLPKLPKKRRYKKAYAAYPKDYDIFGRTADMPGFQAELTPRTLGYNPDVDAAGIPRGADGFNEYSTEWSQATRHLVEARTLKAGNTEGWPAEAVAAWEKAIAVEGSQLQATYGDRAVGSWLYGGVDTGDADVTNRQVTGEGMWRYVNPQDYQGGMDLEALAAMQEETARLLVGVQQREVQQQIAELTARNDPKLAAQIKSLEQRAKALDPKKDSAQVTQAINRIRARGLDISDIKRLVEQGAPLPVQDEGMAALRWIEELKDIDTEISLQRKQLQTLIARLQHPRSAVPGLARIIEDGHRPVAKTALDPKTGEVTFRWEAGKALADDEKAKYLGAIAEEMRPVEAIRAQALEHLNEAGALHGTRWSVFSPDDPADATSRWFRIAGEHQDLFHPEWIPALSDRVKLLLEDVLRRQHVDEAFGLASWRPEDYAAMAKQITQARTEFFEWIKTSDEILDLAMNRLIVAESTESLSRGQQALIDLVDEAGDLIETQPTSLHRVNQLLDDLRAVDARTEEISRITAQLDELRRVTPEGATGDQLQGVRSLEDRLRRLRAENRTVTQIDERLDELRKLRATLSANERPSASAPTTIDDDVRSGTTTLSESARYRAVDAEIKELMQRRREVVQREDALALLQEQIPGFDLATFEIGRATPAEIAGVRWVELYGRARTEARAIRNRLDKAWRDDPTFKELEAWAVAGNRQANEMAAVRDAARAKLDQAWEAQLASVERAEAFRASRLADARRRVEAKARAEAEAAAEAAIPAPAPSYTVDPETVAEPAPAAVAVADPPMPEPPAPAPPGTPVTNADEWEELLSALEGDHVGLLPRDPEELDLTWQRLQNFVKMRGQRYDEAVEQAAVRATDMTVEFIDDHRFRSQFQQTISNFMPFFFAEEQFLKRAARMIKDSPESLRRATLVMNAGRHAGLIQRDADGNEIFIYPGSDYINRHILQFAELMTGMEGMAVHAQPMSTQVDFMLPGFNGEFIDGGVGPIVGFTTAFLADMFPELEALDRTLIRSEVGQGRRPWEHFIPTNMRYVLDLVGPDSMSNARMAGAQQRAIQMAVANGTAPGPDASPVELRKFHDQVRDWARIIVLMDLVLYEAAPLPAGGRVRYGMPEMEQAFTEMVFNSGLPYQEGLALYLERYPNATPWTVFQARSTTGAPIAPSHEMYQWMHQHDELLENYPMAAAWLAPPRDDDSSDQWSARASREMFERGLREQRSPEEFLAEIYYQADAQDYWDTMGQYDRRIYELEQDGQAAEAKALGEERDTWRQMFRNTHPVFAARQAAGGSAERRRQLREQRDAILGTPREELPEGGHATAMLTLMGAHKAFNDMMRTYAGQSDAATRELRRQTRTDFLVWAAEYVALYPPALPYFQSNIRFDDDIMDGGSELLFQVETLIGRSIS